MASQTEVAFAGRRFVADADLALWWPAQSLLVVSDLHLEKATFLAQFGSAIAPYDSADTLDRLARLVARYRPQTLLLLGDTFHDRHAWERLEPAMRMRLIDICASVDQACFVEGNHDAGMTPDLALCFVDDYVRDGVMFSHEPAPFAGPQIIGHFHPKLRVSIRGHKLSGKCFAVNQSLLVMPAFGSFTGGLELRHDAFTALAAGDPFRAVLVHSNTVVSLPSG